mmetsp:Transcript_26312/g.25151  ORF Transcript_26312/g.25151 Transcript_26312/m.25151 type:complete len:344 (+) Transcript_26312:61-1092(+)
MNSNIIMISIFGFILQITQANERTAICISGNRNKVLNSKWNSSEIHFSPYTKHFDGTEGVIADNIVKNIFQPLAHHGFDVFMFVPTSGKYGEPSTENKSICSSLSGNKNIFNTTASDHQNRSANNFFCNVEKERRLLDHFTEQLPHWKGYCYRNNVADKEGFLQQMYGIDRCNEAIKKYSASTGVKYKYKMRLREDMVWNKPIGLINEMQLVTGTFIEKKKCNKTIYITHRETFPGGNEDTFAFGLSDLMDVRMSAFRHFTTDPLSKTTALLANHMNSRHGWNSEIYLTNLLLLNGICLKSDIRFQGMIVRSADHNFKSHDTESQFNFVNDTDGGWYKIMYLT